MELNSHNTSVKHHTLKRTIKNKCRKVRRFRLDIQDIVLKQGDCPFPLKI